MRRTYIGEAALCVTAATGVLLALRGLRDARRDYRTILRDRVNGGAIVTAQMAIRVERIRLVKRSLLLWLGIYLARHEPNQGVRNATVATLIAVTALDDFKSFGLSVARKDVEAIERARKESRP